MTSWQSISMSAIHFPRKSILISTIAEGGQKGRKQLGKGLAGSWFSAGASNQISLMKWIYGIQLIGSEASGFHAAAS